MTNDGDKKEKIISPSLTIDEQGNTQLSFSTEDVKKWQGEEIIPSDLIEYFWKDLERSSAIRQKINEYYERFPGSSPEEMIKAVFNIPRTLSQEESDQVLSEGKKMVEFHEFLVKNWEKLESIGLARELTPLFKNVNQSTHFGITRFIADQMNHLPSLLETSRIEQIGVNEYAIKATKELKEEGVKILEFSYPITAQNEQDAYELAEKIKEKLLGIRHKMWQACWLYANEVRQTQFTAPIIDLMKSCYPNREAKFSAKDKELFYEELRLLRSAEFTLIGSVVQGKKPVSYKYHIPFLRVGGSIGEPGSTNTVPDKVFIDLCAITPVPKKEKMRHVGAPIKKTTLELTAQDCPLSFFLQIRKNQLYGGSREKDKPTHDFPVEQLIESAGLQKTYNSNPRMGIKRLSEKIERAQSKSIITKFQKIKSQHRTIIRIWW